MKQPSKKEENQLFRLGFRRIAGADEAGRGAWAGPLVAAAVILPKKFKLPGLNDSKKLTPVKREELYHKITAQAVVFRVSVVTRAQIDRQGVGRANHLALLRCVQGLNPRPDFVLVDGFSVDYQALPSRAIIRGDASINVIAAASIVAKVTRDRLMAGLHRQYPQYGFDKHKGYGTSYHRRQLVKHGPSPAHRRSFRPIRGIIKNRSI